MVISTTAPARRHSPRHIRRADRRPASGRTFLARQAAGSKHALRLSELPQAFEPERWLDDGDTVQLRRGNAGGLSLPRPHAGPRGVLQPRASAGAGRRRAVRGLHRPHGFSARQSRRPDPLDPRKPGRSATTSRSCPATVRRRRSARSGAATRTSPTESSHEQRNLCQHRRRSGRPDSRPAFDAEFRLGAPTRKTSS